ncbi:membrane protein [Labrys miyagiensis]
MSTLTVTLIVVHTLISIAAILAGVPAIMDLFRSRTNSASIWFFLVTAILTSATGFVLPLAGVTPAVIVAIIALVILAAVLFAKTRLLEGALWRWIYAGGMVASLYLLVFVAIAQAFGKVGVLHDAAPTASEPPFTITQGITLAFFVLLGLVAAWRFHPTAASRYAAA